MTIETTMLVVCTVLIVPLMGGLLAATPWLMRGDECFAVTVPPAAQKEPEIKALKRVYAAVLLTLTVLAAAVGIAFFALGNVRAGLVATVGGCLAIPIASFALMLGARAKVRRLKDERGWHARRSLRSAVVAEGALPHAVSLKWELLHLPIIAATVAIGVLGYDAMPDMVPMQWGFDGQVNTWAEKSVWVMLFAPLVQAFMAACMFVAHVSIARSKKPSSPGAPASSAYAYGLFARAQSVFLVALGVALNLSFVAMQCTMMGVLDMGITLAIILGVTMVAVVGAVVLSVVYGQSGARVMARVADGDALMQDDDRYWKLGVFYANRDDPSLFVPERFGIGWTCNFARPGTWAVIGGVVLLTAAFVVFALAIA